MRRIHAWLDPRVSHVGITWPVYCLVLLLLFAGQTLSHGNMSGMVEQVVVPPKVHTRHVPLWSGPVQPVAPAPHVAVVHPNYQPYWVGHVYASDTGVDLGALVDQIAPQYGLPPFGLLSTLGAECGWKTGSPLDQTYDDCSRWGAWPDVSFGSCQATVETAGGFGVGNGTYADAQYVHQQENNAVVCVRLAAAIMSSYIRYTGIGYPQAEVAWNCGPGQPRWFLLSPTGECLSNYEAYLGWYNAALSHVVPSPPYAASPTPKPTPKAAPTFRIKRWNAFRWHHHEKLMPAYWHHHLSWAASIWRWHQTLGGVRSTHFYRRAHGHGFTKTRFKRGAIFTHPFCHCSNIVHDRR